MTEPRDDPSLERPMYCEHGEPLSEDCAECWAMACEEEGDERDA